jgi:acetyl-CoA carboxylase alpha subunit
VASATQLEFEKPIAELERQIDEIKKTAGDSQLSVAEAIEPLERKLLDLREEVYRNLTPFRGFRLPATRDAPLPRTTSASRSPISSSFTAIAPSATMRRSSAGGRVSTTIR